MHQLRIFLFIKIILIGVAVNPCRAIGSRLALSMRPFGYPTKTTFSMPEISGRSSSLIRVLLLI